MERNQLIENTRHQDLTYKVIGAAIEVHRTFGPGLLESIYEDCLKEELLLRGLKVETQRTIPLTYKQKILNKDFRLDLVVDDNLILELKAVDEILNIHEAQLLTYMKLTNIPLGLLINFNASPLKQGIKRFIFTKASVKKENFINTPLPATLRPT